MEIPKIEQNPEPIEQATPTLINRRELFIRLGVEAAAFPLGVYLVSRGSAIESKALKRAKAESSVVFPVAPTDDEVEKAEEIIDPILESMNNSGTDLYWNEKQSQVELISDSSSVSDEVRNAAEVVEISMQKAEFEDKLVNEYGQPGMTAYFASGGVLAVGSVVAIGIESLALNETLEQNAAIESSKSVNETIDPLSGLSSG